MKEKMFLTLISMYLLSLIFAVSVSADPSNHLGTIMDKPASVTFIAFFTDDDDILTYGAQGTYYIPGDGKWVFDEGSFDVEPAFGETGYIWLYGSNNKCYKSNYTLVQDDPTPYDWGEGQLSESNIEPPSLSATPGPPGTITLNWTAVDGATTYTIYRNNTNLNENNHVYSRINTTSKLTYVDDEVTYPQDPIYNYIVVGKDGSNFGGHSNVVENADASLAVELSSFTALANNTKVTLKWETGSEVGNIGFYVYRSETADGPVQENLKIARGCWQFSHGT